MGSGKGVSRVGSVGGVMGGGVIGGGVIGGEVMGGGVTAIGGVVAGGTSLLRSSIGPCSRVGFNWFPTEISVIGGFVTFCKSASPLLRPCGWWRGGGDVGVVRSDATFVLEALGIT